MSLLVVAPSDSLIMQYKGLRRWGYNVKIIASRHEDICQKHILAYYAEELQQQICKHTFFGECDICLYLFIYTMDPLLVFLEPT